MDRKNYCETFSKRRYKKYVKTSTSTKMKLIKLHYEDNIMLKDAAKIMNINYSSAKTILRKYRSCKKKCIEIVHSKKTSYSLQGKCFLTYKEGPENFKSEPFKIEVKNTLNTQYKDPIWEKIKNNINLIDYYVKGIRCNLQTNQQTLNFVIYLIYSIYIINNKYNF